MIRSFGALRSFLKLERSCSETFVFFLHYRVTSIFLFFCCILISTNTFTGDKIECSFKAMYAYNGALLNNYCWATSTYSIVPSQEHGPHPGVEGRTSGEQTEYLNFFQYLHIILFIEAIAFYVPHMVWKTLETNHLCYMKSILQKSVLEDKEKAELIMKKCSVFIERRWGSFNILAVQYLLCEVFALFNIVVHVYLLDVLFHGKFISLGLFLSTYYNSEIFSDPTRLFPLVTICSFQKYGASGQIDAIDVLCVLPINAINGKIFLCMWVWYALLFPVTLVNFMYLVLSYSSPHFRAIFINVYEKVKSHVTGNPIDESYMKLVTLGDLGDWFVLSSLKNNVDERIFGYLSESILSKLSSSVTEDEEA